MPALLARLAFVLLAMPAIAGPPERGPMPHLVDLYGDPLPEGAVARLGSVRLRHAGLEDYTVIQDGKTIVSVGTDQNVRWWNVEDGRQTRAKEFPADIEGFKMAISRDAKLVAMECMEQLIVWDIENGKKIQSVARPKEYLDSLTFSPDGTILSVGIDGYLLQVIDIKSGKVTNFKLAKPPEPGHRDFLRVQFSSNPQRMFVSGINGPPYRVVVYEVPGMKEVFSKAIRADGPAISANGDRIAYVAYRDGDYRKKLELRWIELATGKDTLTAVKVEDHKAVELAFTSDGKEVVFSMGSTQQLVNLATGKRVAQLAGGSRSNFKVVGSKLFSSEWNRLEIQDLNTQRRIHDEPWMVLDMRLLGLSPNGRVIAIEDTGHERIALWSAENGRFIREVPLRNFETLYMQLKFQDSSRTMTASDALGETRRWSLSRGTVAQSAPLWADENHSRPYSFRLASDSCRLALIVNPTNVDEGQRRLDVWDSATGQVIHRCWLKQLEWANLVDWMPDGFSAVVHLQKAIALVDTQTGTIGPRFPTNDDVLFSSDSRMLAAWELDHGAKTGSATVWEAASGKSLAVVTTKPTVHRDVALAPSERAIVIADGRFLRIVDLATWKDRGAYALPNYGHGHRNDEPANGIHILPGDRQVLTTMIDGTALIWDLTAFPLPKLADKHDDTLRTTWWNELAGEDAKVAYASAWKLSEGPPEDVVRFLRERLKPARDPEANAVKQLIADLNSGEFRTRESASKRLIELGPRVLPYLRAAQKKPDSAEAGRRIEALIEKLSDPVPSPASLQAIRAIAVLERLGTNEARKLLEELARGAAGSPETKSVNSALVRMRALAGGW